MKKFSQVFLSLIFVLGALLLFPSLTRASTLTSVTVAPAVDNVDNLMNQSDATWRFTIDNATALSTSTDAVEITFPAVQGSDWNLVGVIASSTALGGDLLEFATTSLFVNQRTIVIMATSTQTDANNNFIIDIKGVTNPLGDLSILGAKAWSVRTCTLTVSDNPSSGCASDIDSAVTASATLARRGDRVDSWSFTASNYAAGATNVEYTVTFTASTTLNAGEKIWANFPVGFDLTNATTSNQTISGSTQILSTIVATTTSNGLNAVIATTSTAAIAPLASVTFKIGNITNPVIGSYQGLRVFTTTANGGLVDGSFNGDFGDDVGFGNRPPPVDSVQIGGTNTIIGRAKIRQSNGTLRNLTTNEIAQIRVGMGCPDKMFFVGTKRLDATGAFSYDHLLNATYILGIMPDNVSDATFFANYLQPSMITINVTGDETASSSPIFETPDGVIQGTITGGPTGGGVTNVMVRAYTNSSESFSPVFTDSTYSEQGLDVNGTGYFQMHIKSGQAWNLSFEVNNSDGYLTSGSSQYWTPNVDPIFIESGSSTTTPDAYSFVVADKTLNVTLRDGSTNAVIDGSGGGPHPCISIRRTGSDMRGPGGQGICSTTSVGGVSVYQMKVPAGAFSIQVMLPAAGFKEYPVTVLSSDTTVNHDIIIARPTDYISGAVTDPDGFEMQGVSVMAQGSNGTFNQTLTGSDGTYTLYVSPGVYRVEAFAPGYGPLGALTGVSVASGSNATGKNFTISGASFKTISGQVYTDADGSGTYNSGDTPLEGVQVHAYGNAGENGAQTRNDGAYTLMVPAASGYTVEAWSSTYGFIGKIDNVDASNDITNQDFTAAAQGTLQITVTGANTYGLSEIFVGAYSTSTGKGNGSSSWTATSSDADLVTSFSLPAGYYKIDVGTPGYGNLTSLAANSSASSTAITANATQELTISLPSMKTLSGTTVANATVWASRVDGPGKYNTTADSSTGAYSINLPSGNTYMVGASLPGYVNMPTTITNFSSDTTQDLTLTISAYNISGTVSSSDGGAVSEGFVWATKAGNSGWVGSEISADGSYSLAVDSGAWTVYADAPCHDSSNGVSQTGSGTVNITLTSQGNCSFQPPQIQSIVPSTGGVIATSSISVNIPANSLGTGSSNVSFSVSAPDTIPPATLNAAPIGNSVRSVSASDSNGTSISTLSNSIEIGITYDPDDIPAGSSEGNLQLAYWDTTANTWNPVASTLDMTNHTLTGQVSHLTDFAPIIPTAEGAPDTPGGLVATRSGDAGMSLSWDSVSDATSYLLYRDTSSGGDFPYLTTVTSLSHTDSGLSGGIVYYYKVSASNGSGESSASSAVSATTCPSVSNGSVSGSACALSCNSGYYDSGGSCSPIGGGGIMGGVGGFTSPAVSPHISSQTEATSQTQTASQATAQTSTVPVASVVAESSETVQSETAQIVSPVFNKTLKYGMTSDDIKKLQELLATKSEIYPEGIVSGWFGQLTRAAVRRFQCKYDVVCSGSEKTTGYGLVGPKTRVKLAEVFSTATNQSSIPQETSAQKQAMIDSISSKIKILQQKLTLLLNELTSLIQAKNK